MYEIDISRYQFHKVFKDIQAYYSHPEPPISPAIRAIKKFSEALEKSLFPERDQPNDETGYLRLHCINLGCDLCHIYCVFHSSCGLRGNQGRKSSKSQKTKKYGENGHEY